MAIVYKKSLLLVILWSALLAIWFSWYVHNEKLTARNEALIQARSSFEKDLLFRRWNAMMGGVYAPTSKAVPPNPYLSHLPERDITTPSGRKLTLINPAYMTRMIYELAVRQKQYSGHITSLKPLRPANKADPWETAALRKFENGAREIYSEVQLKNKKYLRFMKPLIIEESCLKCHSSQGYQVGDIKGGISVQVPMELYYAEIQEHIHSSRNAVLLIWLLGCLGIFAADRSVTKREISLLDAANQWRTTFDSITDFISVHDQEFRFLRVNKALAEFLGKTPRELIGKTCYQELHLKGRPYPLCPLEESIRTGKPTSHEIDDEQIGIPLLISVSPIYDSAKKISGYIHIAKDMTEIKKSQNILIKSEKRYKSLFEQAPLSYQSLDENGCIIDVNEAWLQLLGYRKEEALGRSFADFLTPAWRPHFGENFPRFKAIGEILGIEFEMIQKDGAKILVSINGKIGYNLEGNFKQAHCLIHNITAERQRENELQQYRNNLEKMVAERNHELEETQLQLIQKEKLAAIGQVAASISHDLRNPLGAISNSIYFLNLVLGEQADEKVARHLKMMQREMLQANTIITDLLDFSRDSLALNTELSDLNRLIKKTVKVFRATSADNITFELQLSANLPPINIDKRQFRRVIDNLLANGIKAMPEGGILGISTQADQDNITVEITDTGSGITPEILKKIFNPLFTTRAKGIGLGLTIVKKIIEKHQGRITVRSDPGEKTTFIILLPL